MLGRMWLQGTPSSVRGLLGDPAQALSWCACLTSLIGIIGSSGCMEADRRLAVAHALAYDAGAGGGTGGVAAAGGAAAGGAGAVPGADAASDADGRADAGTSAPFGAPVMVAGLRTVADTLQDPTLSSDELELYFMSVTGTNADIWRSQRARATDAWGPASVVTELSGTAQDQDPELARGDGLTIYFSSDRGADTGTMHLWFARRTARNQPWGAPEQITTLGTSRADVAPTVDTAGVRLMFASLRNNNPDYHLFAASRPDVTAPWGSVEEQVAINSDYQDRDPAFFDQGNSLVFASRRTGQGRTSDLFLVKRPDALAAFAGVPSPINELNSDAWEGDAWLSESGGHILFVSDRTGIARIYEAWR